MRKRSNISYIFFVLIAFSVLIFFLSQAGFLKGPSSVISKIISPFQSVSFSVLNFLSSGDSRIRQLENENRDLIGRLVDQEAMIKDNEALRDQFETQSPKSTNLLSAKIVGAPGFIPGVTDPIFLILNKGAKDNVEIGSAVVYKDILVGKVATVSDNFSKVSLVTDSSFMITVIIQRTGAVGVSKGNGGRQMILDNVAQSEEIKVSDILVTKGDQNEDGAGIPPGLIIGKLKTIDKKPSAVFQKGEVLTPLDFTKLENVFLIIN